MDTDHRRVGPNGDGLFDVAMDVRPLELIDERDLWMRPAPFLQLSNRPRCFDERRDDQLVTQVPKVEQIVEQQNVERRTQMSPGDRALVDALLEVCVVE